ncbi:VWA domain-containing protein [Bryobacter aggregatus]|uniref:VWA domain-containing protein n=1 Tax=Bryobacter aggregatus TaxID=360054 RepID=UPI0004E14EF9|nr:VWA domain-containing protein [Bryobacter aggregatus]
MRLLAIFCCLLFLAEAQDPEPGVFRGGVTQVRVDVMVSNAKGALTNLRAEDFVIEDEGQTMAINYLGREDEALNLLLLLDVSGSMRDYLEQIGRKARSLLHAVRPADKVGVMGFAKESDYLMAFTNNMDRAANAIDQTLRPGLLPAGTSINAALIDAAQAFLDNPKLSGHRAIFILTDNKALNYRVSDDQTLEKLFAADAVLNAIVTKNAEAPKPYKDASQRNPDFSWADVFKLSAETGGEVIRTDRADEAFGKLLANLRERYLLTYNAPAAPARQFRRIRVTLSKEAQKRYGKVSIRARAGYYTGA